MIDYSKAQLNNALQVQNKKAQDEFVRIFGSLSVKALDFLKSDDYIELTDAIYKYYIQKGYDALEASTAFTIDLKNPETLSRLHDTKLRVLGMKGLHEELVKLHEASKDIRLI